MESGYVMPAVLVEYDVLDKCVTIQGNKNVTELGMLAEMLRGASMITDLRIGHHGDVLGRAAFETWARKTSELMDHSPPALDWESKDPEIRAVWNEVAWAVRQCCSCCGTGPKRCDPPHMPAQDQKAEERPAGPGETVNGATANPVAL